jgi:hypothetical protein
MSEGVVRRPQIESGAPDRQEQRRQEQELMTRKDRPHPEPAPVIGRMKPQQSSPQTVTSVMDRPRMGASPNSPASVPPVGNRALALPGRDVSFPIPDIEAMAARGPRSTGVRQVDLDRDPAMAIPFGEFPTGKIEGGRIRGSTGQCAMEIIVKEGGKYLPRPMSLDAAGQPFVQIHDTEVYAIRLTNNAPYDVAIDLRIDGVNCFAFSEEPLRYWILPPGQPMTVMGWHRNGAIMTEFKVVSESPQSAAARLNLIPSAGHGLITATIHAAWPKGAAPPDDEPRLPVEEARRGKPTTGFGQNLNVKTAEVEREIGAPRDLIWVRYDR